MIPEDAVVIQKALQHPDDIRGTADFAAGFVTAYARMELYTLVWFPSVDEYAMIACDGSRRSIEKPWAAGRELRLIRDKIAVGQARLAQLLHTTANNIARYERGERQIPWASMEVARSLETTDKKGDC